ncbi:MAG: molybdopterin-containing oxidoreductase family protein [Ilumatobacteraceae bacterium]
MTALDDAPAGTTRQVHTACSLDCPDVCSLVVTVTDGRITTVDAAPGNPLTDGWICSKVRKSARRVYAPERVLTPLVRTGPKGVGEFREATWDEAMALVAGRVREALDVGGGDAVVAYSYNSSASLIEKNSLSEALFATIGATIAEHTICAHNNSEAWTSVYRGMRSVDPEDVVHSRLVVVWGANPTVSNTHFPPLVQKAVDEGARVVVIDPRRTAMAARADLHLAVRPGTDLALAYALAAEWQRTGAIDRAFADAHADGVDEFLAAAVEWTVERAADECGLAADDIRALAQWWASTSPALLRFGWGQERNVNGFEACRAILALPVLVGSFGERGSGVLGSTGVRAADTKARWPREAFEGPERRSLALHQISRWLAPGSDDPARVLIVQGANPVVMCPDTKAVIAALSRDDVFTVVHEQVLTDTTRYADVVFPATTSFELDDVTTSYGSRMVLPVRQVIPPVGESRTNDQFGLALARALGYEWEAPPVSVAIADQGPRQLDLPSLQFVDSHPEGGRAQLADPQFGAPVYIPRVDDPRHPLVLISPATSKLVNSMFGEFQEMSTAVRMHPVDAAERGLAEGQAVVVENELASLEVTVSIDDTMRPGVVMMPKGIWLRHHPEGIGVSALCPDTGTAQVNGACFNDARVEVRAV